jgi:hypothetical protein
VLGGDALRSAAQARAGAAAVQSSEHLFQGEAPSWLGERLARKSSPPHSRDTPRIKSGDGHEGGEYLSAGGLSMGVHGSEWGRLATLG